MRATATQRWVARWLPWLKRSSAVIRTAIAAIAIINKHQAGAAVKVLAILLADCKHQEARVAAIEGGVQPPSLANLKLI